jgi:hypothetical protein
VDPYRSPSRPTCDDSTASFEENAVAFVLLAIGSIGLALGAGSTGSGTELALGGLLAALGLRTLEARSAGREDCRL